MGALSRPKAQVHLQVRKVGRTVYVAINVLNT